MTTNIQRGTLRGSQRRNTYIRTPLTFPMRVRWTSQSFLNSQVAAVTHRRSSSAWAAVLAPDVSHRNQGTRPSVDVCHAPPCVTRATLAAVDDFCATSPSRRTPRAPLVRHTARHPGGYTTTRPPLCSTPWASIVCIKQASNSGSKLQL